MLRTRLLTAAVLVAILFYCVTFTNNPAIRIAFFFAFIMLAGAEFIAMRWHTIDGFSHTEFPHAPHRKEHFGIALGYAMVIPAHFVGQAYIAPSLGGSLPAVLTWITVCTIIGSAFFYRREIDLEIATQKLMNALAGFLYIAIPSLLMMYLSEFEFPNAPKGIALYFSFAVVLMGDTGAYFAGRLFGKRLLIPKVSPKKTQEGALGGLLFSAGTAAFVSHYFGLPFHPLTAAFIGVVGGVAGQIGDLAESALKRAANCKDSGALLPGHGGVLDRIDALLFGIPICYFAFLIHSA